MKQKKLAILGAGEMGKVIARRAKELGNIETHCFAWEKGAVARPYVDYFYPISIVDENSILNKCKEIGIDGVIATNGMALPTASLLHDELGVIGNSYQVSKNLRDKFKNRVLIQEIQELKNPRFLACKKLDELEKTEFNYPVIVKPVSTGGKKGVSMANNKLELIDAFHKAMVYTKNDDSYVIIEEYINGTEYSVESLSYKGTNYIIQITEKDSSGPPLHVELGHHQPANISREIWNKIVCAVDKGLSAIGIENGPCHTEVKVWNDEVYLIEFNARPGGDHIAYPLTELSSGYPYISGIIQIALDELTPIYIQNYTKKYAGIYFVVKQTKKLLPIFENCENSDWCYEKKKFTDELVNYTHNDGYNTNYFIYCSDKKPL